MEMKDWIKAARGQAGMTLEQLGEIVGRTKANVHGWEKGSHQPSVTQFLRIARVTKMNPAELDDWPADLRVSTEGGDDEQGVEMTGWPLSPELLAALQNADPQKREFIENTARLALGLSIVQAAPQQTSGAAA